jgi:GT2 family glycosyltransferase/SAM-dependent methyltransferase
MGEIFEKVRPAKSLPWTGERLTTGAGAQVEIEHLHRYFIARELCRGLDVLDIASGEGYGSALLGQTAKSVVGVELDADAVTHALAAYSFPHVQFLQGDARRIPLEAASVDVVVSFETIEHFYDHDVFLAEVRRVLRPGGKFIVSSPERDVYSEGDAAPNPYHIRELTRDEFLRLLRANFANVVLQGQRPVVGSALITETLRTPSDRVSALVFERRGQDYFEVSQDLPRPVYSLAIASDDPIMAVADSLYIAGSKVEDVLVNLPETREQLEKTSQALNEAGIYARKLESEISARDSRLEVEIATRDSRLEEEIAARQASEIGAQASAMRAESMTARLTEAERVASALAAKLADVAADALHTIDPEPIIQHLRVLVEHRTIERDIVTSQMNVILGSSSWRVSRPFRRALEDHPFIRRMLRRSAKLVWWTVTFKLFRRLFGRSSGVALAAPPPAPPVDEKARFTASLRADLLSFLATDEKLAFSHVGTPEISVVIVLWNQAHLTLKCLRALFDQDGPSIEVILVDNASSDETEALLTHLEDVRIVRNTENVGFLLGCNQGASVATGRTILLLNSDAFVRSQSLAAALETLDGAANVGAVGGRLILPSGKLQEAGSIVWSDGSTLGYGRGLAADASEGMFRRDVDYCSGAFLLTTRSLWNRLDGFDEAFAPAYYEETDYCMRLWAAGYRVVYEPAAVIDHFEFGSESKTGDGQSAQLRNRALFQTRHHDALAWNHLPPLPENILLARSHQVPPRPRLLVIDDDVPLGSLGSGYPRARELLAAANGAGWSVTLFPLHRLKIDWEIARTEIPWEVEIVAEKANAMLVEFLNERRGFYDVVIISRPDNMRFIRSLVRRQANLLQGLRVIYDAEAVATNRDVARAALEGRPYSEVEAKALIEVEVALARDATAVVCVSEAEAALFKGKGPSVHVLSHAVQPVLDSPEWDMRSGFLFVGRLLERDSPNWRGLAWFIALCWPLIRAAMPRATLSIIGRLHDDHGELEAPGVRLLGSVADLAPIYNRARVFIAPVHFAAGVPIKVLDAAAAGLPVVGTRLMAEQLCWTRDVELAAEDDAVVFAAKAVSLHEDQPIWTAMRAAALNRIQCEHSKEIFEERVHVLLNGTGTPPAASDLDADPRPVGPHMASVERA